MHSIDKDLFDRPVAPEPERYPDAPGHRGVDTSIAAAEDIAPKCGRLQKMTLDVIRARGAVGLTADEAAEAVGLDRWSIQPRVSELKAKRLIADSGQRRRNSTGKNAICWVAVEFIQAKAA